MELRKMNVYFLFILIVGISILSYFVVKPFLVPFVIAAILTQLFYPTYNFLTKVFKKKGISSGLTCLIIAVIIIVPLLFVGSLVINEVRIVVSDFSNGSVAIENMISKINGNLSSLPFVQPINIKNIISQDTIASLVKTISQNTLSIIQTTYRGVGHFIFVVFILFFSMFYLFIDGKKLMNTIMQFSPLKNSYESKLVEKFVSISRATLKGTSLVAVIQGASGAVLFFLTGVSSYVLLGVLMIIASVIPTIGSGLIWFPVGLVMILLGYVGKGVTIWIVGSLGIGLIDNILRQKLIGRDVQMHPLLILFSTLGGIAIFGIAGFIIGPIIMALFLSLWEIYFIEFKDQLVEFNK